MHTTIAPALKEDDPVIYLGDLDFAGGHIEGNTQRVLEREVGPLAWERLALTAAHRRSTKMLSRQAPFPSMLILISFLSSRPVKAMLVNWEP